MNSTKVRILISEALVYQTVG